MKARLFILFIINGFILAGCGNSSQKQQGKVVVQQINPLEKTLKEAYTNKETLYDLIRKDIIKERIIKEYSQNFYDKVFHYVQVVSPITYEQGVYYGDGWEAHLSCNIAKFTYSPNDDELIINLSLDGRVVQSDGEIHYNTEGWKIELAQNKNEFGEIVNTYYGAEYVIENGEDMPWDRDKFVTVVFAHAIILWTNNFGDLSDVNAILIKDHDSGEIYNIQYNERYHDDSSRRDHDIGVVLTGSNMMNFMDLTSRLTNFSILIKSNYDDSVLISNPENFNNIADVYQQIIVNTQKLRENENK